MRPQTLPTISSISPAASLCHAFPPCPYQIGPTCFPGLDLIRATRLFATLAFASTPYKFEYFACLGIFRKLTKYPEVGQVKQGEEGGKRWLGKGGGSPKQGAQP